MKMLPPDFCVVVRDVCTDFTAVKTRAEQIHPAQYDADFSISKLQHIFLAIYNCKGSIIVWNMRQVHNYAFSLSLNHYLFCSQPNPHHVFHCMVTWFHVSLMYEGKGSTEEICYWFKANKWLPLPTKGNLS